MMKVKELRAILNEIPEGMTQDEFDNLDVLIPMGETFDGFFKSPCPEETGMAELGVDENSDKSEQSFVIVPHGFFEEVHGVPPELN